MKLSQHEIARFRFSKTQRKRLNACFRCVSVHGNAEKHFDRVSLAFKLRKLITSVFVDLKRQLYYVLLSKLKANVKV